VADDARPELPRDVVLLPLEPPAHQVGDGPAHGSDVTGAGLRDELDEPVPLVAAVPAHRRDHGPHPLDRHGCRRGLGESASGNYH